MKWNFSVAFAFGLFFLSILTISFFFFWVQGVAMESIFPVSVLRRC